MPVEHLTPDVVPSAASLRPDGMAVAVAGTGIAVWDLNPKHLQAAACRLAGRNLSRTEWETYLVELGRYRSTCLQYA